MNYLSIYRVLCCILLWKPENSCGSWIRIHYQPYVETKINGHREKNFFIINALYRSIKTFLMVSISNDAASKSKNKVLFEIPYCSLGSLDAFLYLLSFSKQRFILSPVVVEMFHALSQLAQVLPPHLSRMEACSHKCSRRFHLLLDTFHAKSQQIHPYL